MGDLEISFEIMFEVKVTSNMDQVLIDEILDIKVTGTGLGSWLRNNIVGKYLCVRHGENNMPIFRREETISHPEYTHAYLYYISGKEQMWVISGNPDEEFCWVRQRVPDNFCDQNISFASLQGIWETIADTPDNSETWRKIKLKFTGTKLGQLPL